MLNGYQAGLSNTITQNIIIHKPGSTTLYYLFTTDVQGGHIINTNHPNAFGINYAIIDMNMDGGLGSAVSVFNSLKDTSNCEKLTAIQHANGQDIWLIGHEYRNNKFFVFQITTAGINTTPTFYSIGPIINTYQIGVAGNSNFDAIGELKASTDGSKLAFTTFYNGTTALFDFDKANGTISNAIDLNLNRGGYGLSFSPDNSKLYIAAVDTGNISPPNNGQIIQFDISSGNQTLIQNSKTIIYTCTNCGFGSLKIAPDRKIYVARYGEQGNNAGDSYLGVINYPDSIGLSCNYVHNGLYLNGLRGSWGLNNLMENTNYCTISSISENENENSLVKVSPNPFSSTISVTIQNQNLKQVLITVENLFGQIIFKKEKFHLPPTFEETVDLSLLTKGVYFVRVISEREQTVKKIVKD